MKIKFFQSLRRCLSGAITAGAVSLLGAGAQAAAPVSPAGDWDLILSGSGQSGIALLSFSDDGTFSGHQTLVPSKPAGPSTDGRNTGGDVGRNADLNTNAVGSTVLFGFGPVSGPWQYDDKGQVVGFFTELIGGGHKVCTTNENITTVHSTTTVPVTNPDGSVTFYETNITIFITNAPTIDCVTQVAQTNAVSFTAKVVPGHRLTMVSSTPNGKVTYRGIPLRTDLRDLTGSWTANRKSGGQTFLELFDLVPMDGFPNVYTSNDGMGPGYDFNAVCMLSAQRKIGFTFITSDGVLRASMGSFSSNFPKARATTKGIEDGAVAVPFNFNASILPEQ